MTSETIKPKEVDRFSTNEKACAVAELRAWLQLDTWTVREGLLILVGIDPYRSDDLFLTEGGFHTAPNPSWAQITARPGLSVDKVDAAGWPRITGYFPDLPQIMELSHLLNLWISSLSHTLKDRHVPSYYLQWANGKDCNPFWQPWAIDAGLFPERLTKPVQLANAIEQRQTTRLARLRELGGDRVYKDGKWCAKGHGPLEMLKAEIMATRAKPFSPKTISDDLDKAAERERELKRGSVYNRLLSR